jgi:hypothetical protein
MLSEPNDYIILFVRFDGPTSDVIPKTVTPAVTKEILTCQKQSLTNSVYPLATLFSHWK